jgi:hypothetical protein
LIFVYELERDSTGKSLVTIKHVKFGLALPTVCKSEITTLEAAWLLTVTAAPYCSTYPVRSGQNLLTFICKDAFCCKFHPSPLLTVQGRLVNYAQSALTFIETTFGTKSVFMGFVLF